MQRQQRGELAPVGEALANLPGQVKSLRDASPQARHHFTRLDQVNQFVGVRFAGPELGFMARMMLLCSLPRTNPGNRHQYKRVNGPWGRPPDVLQQRYSARTRPPVRSSTRVPSELSRHRTSRNRFGPRRAGMGRGTAVPSRKTLANHCVGGLA